MQQIVLISKMEANLTKIEILIDSVYKEQCHEYLGKLSIKTEIDSALIDCIKQSVTTWSATRVTPRSHVISFTLNLASFLCRNEENFNALNSRNFFIKLVNVSKVRVNQVTLSVKLAYIKLLSSFLEHTSGVEWMIACNFWEDVYQLCLSNQNREIIKKSTHFVSKLLEITVRCDGKFCDNVVQRIILPLSENIYKSVAGEHLQPTLKLLGDILEYFLQGILSDEKNFDILFVFLKKFRLDERISDFIGTEQSKCFSFRLGKIVFIMQFLELYVKISTNGSSAGDIDATIRNIKNNFILSTFKEDFKDVVEFSYFGQLYWKLVDSKIPQVKTLPFSNQLAIALIIPHCCLMFRFCYDKGDWEEMLTDEFRDVYIHKLYQMVGHDMLRTCYLWRDSVIDRPNIFEICAQCNDRIRRAQRYLSRESAVVIVQMLIYNLKDCVHFVKQSPQKLESFVNQELYFEQIFGILAKFIEDFRITWKDSLEATDILTICFDFFLLHSWPKHIGVKVLNLINIATAKYMAPNLALLLDNTTDSTVALLGPLLYAKLFDVSEVKRAALDVICTMASISRSKFPSLQKVLMDSELPTLVVKMSTCDGESFVRATAIKCLQEMIQVEEIWNNALQTEDLPQKMRDVLLNETEGIVRVEAATFMCVAYEHQQFQKENLDRIYETMIYSSTTDLHWEVKIRALSFWDKVIKNHLQNQGMIDDSFPNVTFSKEHRKIVTLTDSEIRKRLLKVLSQLSAIGCLGVLMSAIKDDCDMEVSKTAVKITQRLVDLFRKYNVRSDSSVPTSPSPTENGMSGTVSMSSGISVDENMDSPASNNHDLNEEILEQIVNSKDVALLKNVYVASDYGSVSNYDIQVRKIVTPNEFLQFTQQDLNNIITEKKNWLNGIEDLGSLLDDMLKTYDDDVNNMDCY